MADPRAKIENYYREIGPRLMSYLLAGGADEATAGDLVQETFLKLWGMRERLEDDRERVSGLIFTADNLGPDVAGLRGVDEIAEKDLGIADEVGKLFNGVFAGQLPAMPEWPDS